MNRSNIIFILQFFLKFLMHCLFIYLPYFSVYERLLRFWRIHTRVMLINLNMQNRLRRNFVFLIVLLLDMEIFNGLLFVKH